MKESLIQKAILEYLAARHILAFRMQTGSVMKSYGGKQRRISFGTPGMADILACPQFLCDDGDWRPRFLWIEVKGDGKQSELQKSFQAQVEEQNHTYIVARSIEDVAAVL